MANSEQHPSHPVFAAVYDRINKGAEENLVKEHREYLAADLHGMVLDLGAGTGAMFPYFKSAIKSNPSLDLHAIEPDPHMRKRAVQKAREFDLDIEIQPNGAQTLPYADASFDVVIASLVFCTIPKTQTALDEVARILKPSGEFRFLEHVHADGVVGRVQDIVNPVWRRTIAGCNLNRKTVATFRSDDRFKVSELDEIAFGIPPVKPFMRGTLTRKEDAVDSDAHTYCQRR
ncbi:Methyltransferase domain-containing protein [Halogranum amylolyticum]|uniref:Methyltransferase domain-containing protein n=1 Tax=Halogranum amylolyticum TaxID=660520 RepID=A0A1H8VB65_9EURY|nr:class I SAM-dependent methyltransferase [Halogranum amylolyticum]SEP12635.1 Methyltransferase domain-containing protein [Halogranum amylolyticum]